MSAHDKIVVVTKKTTLEELVRRFNTRDQARFYVEHMGASFDEYQAAHDAYRAAAAELRAALPATVRAQWIDREFLPTFTFGARDLVVTLGPDGLVVNAAKYLHGQPLLAFNPDAKRIDGVLVPFPVGLATWAFPRALAGSLPLKKITMARASLNDGQTIDAVNDLFVGRKTHVSARYRLRHRGREEGQSSSGLIVSTGAGSTGWLRSVLAGAAGVFGEMRPGPHVADVREGYQFDWESKYLVFSVREPFVSKVSRAEIVFDKIGEHSPLEIVSEMPQDGVIFSDGVEEDHLAFNSGAIATIGLADRQLHLLVSGESTEKRTDPNWHGRRKKKSAQSNNWVTRWSDGSGTAIAD